MKFTEPAFILSIAVALVAAVCCGFVPVTVAFAPAVIHRHIASTLLSSQLSAAASSTTDSKVAEFPPLSEDKIRKFLDSIPVYAVIDPSKEAIVLLAEKGNPNSLAYLSFSPTQISDVYAPLRAQQDASVTWEVTAFPLGLVWFDLLKNPGLDDGEWVVDSIDYRLLPDQQQLKEARNMMQQASKKGLKSEYFQKDFNEIPLFIDDFLRVQDRDGNPLVPIYLGLDDLLETCQRAVDASEGKYQASVNLSDLRKIINQMQQPSPTNFEQAVLIPPSGPVGKSKAEEEYEIPSIPTDEGFKSTEIDVPVINQWDD